MRVAFGSFPVPSVPHFLFGLIVSRKLLSIDPFQSRFITNLTAGTRVYNNLTYAEHEAILQQEEQNYLTELKKPPLLLQLTRPGAL